MTRELFVSSTPHETRVGLVEDDQLAEIYLERENEYTLAGSIYKGRVTRVLPGMQSAFVDIGLERDAFLYVSDFMEVEEGDEVEEVPTNRPAAPEPRRQAPPQAQPRAEGQSFVIEGPDFPEEAEAATEQPAQSAPPNPESREASNDGDQRDNRGGWRGRRRRRGRRGERFPESKFARPSAEAPREAPRSERSERTERSDYGPPPGYQPILLPGESISKYQRLAQAPAVSDERHQEPSSPSNDRQDVPGPVAQTFPEDEPLFASAAPGSQEPEERREEQRAEAHSETAEEAWDREQKRLHQMNVAAVFGGEVAEEEDIEADDKLASEPEHSDQAPTASSAGTLEEEEIDDEEADLAHYVEDIEEDSAFEELEEETRAAEDYREHGGQEIAASGEPVGEAQAASADALSAEATETEEVVDEAAEEAAAEEEEEAELEEAQAEAEAILDAEARGDGTVDARAEVRAPAGTAAYTQRAARPAFDRRGRGRRGGGRRFPRRREPQQIPQITDLLKEGQEILVQIAKEPIGKKGARITSHIALPGRFLVYMPTVNHTGVSRKIASEEERQRLKRIIQSERENGHGGFIVRTAAQGANEEELRADIRFLKGLWIEIKNRAESGKAPALIYHDLNVV